MTFPSVWAVGMGAGWLAASTKNQACTHGHSLWLWYKALRTRLENRMFQATGDVIVERCGKLALTQIWCIGY
jgi:hypothetical protein